MRRPRPQPLEGPSRLLSCGPRRQATRILEPVARSFYLDSDMDHRELKGHASPVLEEKLGERLGGWTRSEASEVSGLTSDRQRLVASAPTSRFWPSRCALRRLASFRASCPCRRLVERLACPPSAGPRGPSCRGASCRRRELWRPRGRAAPGAPGSSRASPWTRHCSPGRGTAAGPSAIRGAGSRWAGSSSSSNKWRLGC